ncbi:hypothetical protein DJ021_04260 [Phenylobacterium hankyongense]|uniref:Uncharacterized protein n=1 Tax=Phenylobacterium hankyongense TaxID=1813876 RepID=A0A328AY02_9CAUL|nr:DUF6491 family protein [Phenylobacterium hankyongense]RAK59071.1 hypothetical protein DJ021_04260 [Phenylobacterium hankyongense]
MNIKIALAALLAAAASGALALGPGAAQAKPAQPHRDCFWSRSVNSFAAPNEKVVNLRVGVHDVYQAELFGSCPDIDWNQSIALVSRGSSFICSGLDAEIVTHSTIGPQRCPVRNIRKLSAAEVAALPRNAKP